MEQKLLRQKGISKAEIFLGLSGEMSIEVTERTPIVPVLPEGYNGYYLSVKKGCEFPYLKILPPI